MTVKKSKAMSSKTRRKSRSSRAEECKIGNQANEQESEGERREGGDSGEEEGEEFVGSDPNLRQNGSSDRASAKKSTTATKRAGTKSSTRTSTLGA